MKLLLVPLLLLAGTHFGIAAPKAIPPAKPAGNMRTFLDCPGLPRESLRRGVSAKFYKSLTISPLDAWVVVQAH